MSSRITHFEIPTSDSAASRKFYETVLGWKFMNYGGGPVEYWLVTTGEDSETGINGGLGGAANDFKGTVVTAEVDNIDATIQKVVANGGQIIMPKEVIPNMGYVAYFKDPAGVVMGLFQVLPGAGM